MTAPSLPPTPPPPGATLSAPAGIVTGDVACRKCAYNLRGLPADGRCPECGTAVGYSLQGDLLRFCDPNWVDTLRRGAAFFIWGAVAIIFGFVAIFALAVSGGNATLALGGLAVVLLGVVLTLAGWWLMTQPDPSGLGEQQYGRARKIIRVALVAGLVGTALDVIAGTLTMNDELLTLVGYLSLLASIVGVVGMFAQLNYLSRIARRIPDDRLADRAHFLMYAFNVPYVLLLLLQAAGKFAGPAAVGRSPAVGCFNAVLGLTLIVFGIMYLLLVEKLGKRFKEQARFARTSWAAGFPART